MKKFYPNGELRWLESVTPDNSQTLKLQQKWVEQVHTDWHEPEVEWRDVPVVTEDK